MYFIPNHRSRKIVDHGVSTAISLKYSSYVENSWVISIVPSMVIVASVLPVKYKGQSVFWPLPGQYIAKGSHYFSPGGQGIAQFSRGTEVGTYGGSVVANRV